MTINDAATWRVLQSLAAINNKEILDDSFVYNEEVDLGASCSLIVQFIEGLLELRDLCIYHLSSLSGTHTISIDDDVSRKDIIVVHREKFKSLLDAAIDLVGDHFLAFLLYKEVRVILRHLLVY